MWRRSASFILDGQRSSNSPPMENPNPNPDAISAYYQTRAEHHGVITCDWLAQAQAAVGGADQQQTVSSATAAASSGVGTGESFVVIDEFNNWRKQPDLAEAIAAIRALAAVFAPARR